MSMTNDYIYTAVGRLTLWDTIENGREQFLVEFETLLRPQKQNSKKSCSTIIISILLNPVYTGYMVWNRVSFAKFFRISEKKQSSLNSFRGTGRSGTVKKIGSFRRIHIRRLFQKLLLEKQRNAGRTRPGSALPMSVTADGEHPRPFYCQD